MRSHEIPARQRLKSGRAKALAATAVAIAAGVLLPGTSPAQTAEWAGVMAAARKEGRVVFYGSTPIEAGQRLLAGFKKAYPDIAIDYVRGTSAQMVARVDQERAAGADGGDVWLGAEVLWFQSRDKEGLLLKPVGPSAADWPKQYWRGANVVAIGIEPFVMVYNTKLVPTPPRRYADLLTPDFKGRIGANELAASSVVAWYDWMEKTQMPDYLARLKALNVKLYASAVGTSQAIASGEIAATPGTATVTTTKPLMERGAPINFVRPVPAFGFEYAAAAFSWSKRPNAALVVLDYLMSVEGQTILYGTGEGASPRPNIPGSMPASEIQVFDASKYTPDVVRAYREHWNRIMK
ncbi:MAG: extracellular solute-binding protein [Betaproteobacteria bacterium]|nr:extracellular solute-binding protein [Betaproteobacteria bacterium]